MTKTKASQEAMMTLRTLVDLRDKTLQKSRIAFGNRVSAVERGTDDVDKRTMAMLERWQERFSGLEKYATEDIKTLAQDIPIIDLMIDVKGVGYTLAAKVVSMIDIERADTVSALWRYGGYGVIDGEAERRRKGEKLHYNSRLKTTLHLLGKSLIRKDSAYRPEYDKARVYYDEHRPDWTKLHKHYAAMRKVIKLWLQHLWMTWRTLENLPTNEPYIMADPKHSRYKAPTEYGWPVVSDNGKAGKKA
jgi:hypothetical protein